VVVVITAPPAASVIKKVRRVLGVFVMVVFLI
jgi:hypothetical protein